MGKKRNFHKSFKKFAENLMIPGGEKDALMAARKAVRYHIRAHFADMGATPRFLDAHESQVWKWAFPQGAKPRFLTQGSFAYHTLNRPHTTPPQQVDLDDGVYFAVSEASTLKAPSSLLSKALFREIESALEKLAREKGWKLVADKPACVRLIISRDAHIDIPSYVISEEEMKGLQFAQANHDTGLVSFYEQAGLQYHPEVPTVWLAHRKEGWIPSDPRKVLDWVAQCVADYGPAYRNICRYLKAWRDCQWEKSPLSSICIMAIVDNALKKGGVAIDPKRHDKSVLSVVECMKSQVLNGVPDPTNDGKRLDQNISVSERKDICERIDVLQSALQKALHSLTLSTGDAVNLLCKQFGRHFPKAPDLVIKIAVAVTGGATPAVTGGATPVVVPVRRPWAATHILPSGRQTEIADASKIIRDSEEWLARSYPDMQVTSANTISGILPFWAEMVGSGKKVKIYPGAVPSTKIRKNYIADKYELDIRFSTRFGVVWPHVKEPGGRLQRRADAKSIGSDHVFLENGELCLEATHEIFGIMQADSGLKNFFEYLLIPILYYHSYCERYDEEPWPGLAHGFIGLLEVVPDSEESAKWETLIRMLELEAPRHFFPLLRKLKRDLKPHSPCFCLSGKKIKKCGDHRKAMAGVNALRRYLQNFHH